MCLISFALIGCAKPPTNEMSRTDSSSLNISKEADEPESNEFITEKKSRSIDEAKSEGYTQAKDDINQNDTENPNTEPSKLDEPSTPTNLYDFDAFTSICEHMNLKQYIIQTNKLASDEICGLDYKLTKQNIYENYLIENKNDFNIDILLEPISKEGDFTEAIYGGGFIIKGTTISRFIDNLIEKTESSKFDIDKPDTFEVAGDLESADQHFLKGWDIHERREKEAPIIGSVVFRYNQDRTLYSFPFNAAILLSTSTEIHQEDNSTKKINHVTLLFEGSTPGDIIFYIATHFEVNNYGFTSLAPDILEDGFKEILLNQMESYK